MKSLLFIFSLLILSSSGNEPLTVTTTESKEVVWTKVLNFFSRQGVPIKTVDKTSGIIQSDKLGLGSHTVLDNESKFDSTAWAICTWSQQDKIDKEPIFPTGELFISVQENDGKTTISINLLNLQAMHSKRNFQNIVTDQYYVNTIQTSSELKWSNMRSTKVLEAQIAKNLLSENTTFFLDFDNFDVPIKYSAEINQAEIAKRKRKRNKQIIFWGILSIIMIIVGSKLSKIDSQ